MTERIKFLRRSLEKSTDKEVELKCISGSLPVWLNGIVRTKTVHLV